MSRGIGRTQAAILDTLADLPPKRDVWGVFPSWLTVMELAERLGLRDNQVRRAVRALEGRGLVRVTKDTGPSGAELSLRLATERDRRLDALVRAAAERDRRLAGHSDLSDS